MSICEQLLEDINVTMANEDFLINLINRMNINRRETIDDCIRALKLKRLSFDFKELQKRVKLGPSIKITDIECWTDKPYLMIIKNRGMEGTIYHCQILEVEWYSEKLTNIYYRLIPGELNINLNPNEIVEDPGGLIRRFIRINTENDSEEEIVRKSLIEIFPIISIKN